MVPILYTSSDHPLYLYQVFKWTQKCLKGNNSIIKGRVMVLFSAQPLTILYIFMKLSEKPFYVLKVTEQTQFQMKITEGHNSLRILSRVMVLTLCIFSDHALYLKILKL